MGLWCNGNTAAAFGIERDEEKNMVLCMTLNYQGNFFLRPLVNKFSFM
jgi:hypothetical protein